MDTNAVRELVSEVSRALHEGDHASARDACERLCAASPRDAGLQRQLAEICRTMGDERAQLEALERAAELFAEAGQVIQAIGACKQILAIDPDHSKTQQRLDLLYLDGSGNAADGVDLEVDVEINPLSDAPLDELLLTETVPSGDVNPEPEENVARIALDPGNSVQWETDAVRAFEMQTSLDARERTPSEELARTPLFGSLDAESMRRLIERVELVELAEGEVLFRQGDRADTLYVVVEGAVVAIAEGEPRRKLAVLEESEFFGEIGLVTNQPRSATIEAIVDSRLLALDRNVIWELIREQPSVFKVMLRFLRERFVDRLARTGQLFSGFSPEERIAVARQFRLLEIRDEAVLIEQGREAPGLHLLLSGSMRVIYMDSDGDKELATLEPGDVFGEVSLVTGSPTTAAVVASGKCWVLCLPEERYRGLVARHPEVGTMLEEIAASREAQNRETLRSGGSIPGSRKRS